MSHDQESLTSLANSFQNVPPPLSRRNDFSQILEIALDEHNWRVRCENSNSPRIAIFQESEKRLSDVVEASNERYSRFKTFLNYSGTLQIQKNSILVECECTHSIQSWQLVDQCGFHNKEGGYTAFCIVGDCVWDYQTVVFCIQLLSTSAFVHKWRSVKRTEKNVRHVS